MKQVSREEFHNALEPYVGKLEALFYNDNTANFDVVIKSTNIVVAKSEYGNYFIAENLPELLQQEV